MGRFLTDLVQRIERMRDDAERVGDTQAALCTRALDGDLASVVECASRGRSAEGVMTLRGAAVAAALLGAPGCIWEPPPTAHPTAFWPADGELADAALAAAARIEAATGVQITVAHDPRGAVPIVWAGAVPDREWWGRATHTTRGAPIVLIAEQTPPPLRATLVLHELLHTLGARHVASGEGVLSPEIWEPFALTAADLESVCAEAPCERFEPER